jgi:hypothetical protein
VSRSRSAQRWRIGAGLVAAVFAIAGCGSNFNAQSEQIYQPAVGLSDRSGQVYAINTLVVTNGKGDGTVIAALINQAHHDDHLRSVTVVDGKGSQLQVAPLPANGLRLPSTQSVQLADSGAVRVSGPSLEAGTVVTVTFTFAQAAPVTLDVPVVEDSSTYASVPVGPAKSG